MKNATSTDKGRLAEDRALEFLEGKGLLAIDRNYRSPQGEIDLIMRDRDTTVFVEVRCRSNNRVLHVLETIDRRKQEHIIRASRHYLQHAEKKQSRYYRFDVISISGSPETANIEWIKNAFDA